MELSNSNIKTFLVLYEIKTSKKFLKFTQKKAFLKFRETETPKKPFMFQENELSEFENQIFYSDNKAFFLIL